MDKASFSKLIGEIYLYFRYSKMPNETQISLWHKDCSYIPDIASDWIFEQIRRGDSIPRNIPKELTKLWYSYRRAHPEKTANEFTFCGDCLGHGIHIYEKIENIYNPPMPIRYVAMCSECNNWEKHFYSVTRNGGKIFIDGKAIGFYVPPVSRMSKDDIINSGCNYISQSDPRSKPVIAQVPKINFKELPYSADT